MPIELFNKDGHLCLMFTDLCREGGEAVQSNQFLLIDNKTGVIVDPGGNLAYGELYLGMTQHFAPHQLSAIIASHADPDIIASLDRWMTATATAKVYISRIWERFVPHFCKSGKTTGRIVGIPDPGMRIPLGRGHLLALPAHFLHSEGNFQFYDPVSRILFSGDLGASLGHGLDAQTPVTSLAEHLPYMEGFHRRYMVANKVLRHWAQMVRKLPIDMIVPQHGAPMKGPAVQEFIDWVETLSCGIDLMTDRDYAIPG
ncbi:MBL fold metallo-hydrolase [Paucibacter sp. KBW04]|uniref:MBL fold metallo-hydrolase n=1 Tax=Paucibacter sp. KBW04 TaxID=2153361 RepID=UPI000F5790E0|nr:MBL fold metallo-hydrolase [Paucibacter sp. KBW04]RQO53505.1 MBL fold metallo-hydrolase [Paucibacter sp. KBW04]